MTIQNIQDPPILIGSPELVELTKWLQKLKVQMDDIKSSIDSLESNVTFPFIRIGENWRLKEDGDDLLAEKTESGSWNAKGGFNP